MKVKLRPERRTTNLVPCVALGVTLEEKKKGRTCDFCSYLRQNSKMRRNLQYNPSPEGDPKKERGELEVMLVGRLSSPEASAATHL